MGNSVLIDEAVRLRQNLRKSHFGEAEIFRIYLGTPISHLFVGNSWRDIRMNNKSKKNYM